ncbi:MAG TPA: hypothetical protein VHE35_13355 [Kofleriaceae bacterium]|nr:hypothetical protein [Kofleriaceae bacterium]
MVPDDAGDAHDPKGKDVAPRERELHESLRERLEAIIPDLVRRTVAAGMGAVASTEDGLRRLTRDLQIPTVAGNVAGYLADTADTTKDKVLEIIAREVRDFLAHVNLSDEIARLLTTLSFEIKTEIRFIPNSERYTGVEPDVKAAVRVKRSDAKDAPAGAPADGARSDPRADASRADASRPEPRDDAPRPSRSDRSGLGRLRRLWRRATDPLDLIPDDDEPAS